MKTTIIKRVISYLSIILFIAILSGCESILDEPPKNRLTTEVALSTLDGLEGSVLGIYERGRFVHTENDYSLYKCCNTDLIEPGSHLTDQSNFNEFVRLSGFDAESSAVEAIFNGYYQGLSRANIVIEQINDVAVDESRADQTNRRDVALGEAYFFRAYFHLTLIQRWDNIVLADHVFDDPSEAVTLASREDVYNLIIEDIQTAIPLLPEASDVISRGKVSKGVARHLLSKAYMDLGNWTEAAALAVQVIEDPAYNDLTASEVPVENIFSCTDQENKEIIFSWQYSKDDQTTPQRTSTQFVPLYDRVDGVARTFEQGGRPWARLFPSEYYFSLFEENDLRHAWHKRYWVYDIDDPEADPLPAGVSIGDTVTAANVEGTSGFSIDILIRPTTKKYWEDATFDQTTEDAEGYRNIILYRVSEAYLIAAEAYMRAGQTGTGQPYLDAVRSRAGVASIPLTEANLIDEHARELGHEGHRYAFLKRLGILKERIELYSPEIGANMEDHHVRWPLPKSFVDLTKVQQNIGYE